MSLWAKNIRPPEAQWAGLPSDILDLILDKLSSTDCISVSNVCRPWREVLGRRQSHKHPPPRGVPLLVMSGQKDRTLRSFYSVFEATNHEIDLPEACGYYIWGSSEDWVICANKFSPTSDSIKIRLLNPFTKAKIDLPQIRNHYQSVVMGGSPADQCCVCMLLGNLTRGLAFCAPGEHSWRTCTAGNKHFRAAVCRRGCFYLLDCNFGICVLGIGNILENLHEENFNEKINNELQLVTLPYPRAVVPIGSTGRSYLVESGGDILLVCRFTKRIENGLRETQKLEILRLEERSVMRPWVRMEGSLRGRALFLGRGGSRSFCAEELAAPSVDWIFYVYDEGVIWLNEWDAQNLWIKSSNFNDWAMFNFRLRQNLSFGGRRKPIKWAPTWVTAPLWWFGRDRGVQL